MEIRERIDKDHKYDCGSLKITLDGRDVSEIAREADPIAGWVELLIVLPKQMEDVYAFGGYLVNNNGAVTHKAHGEVVITGEQRKSA